MSVQIDMDTLTDKQRKFLHAHELWHEAYAVARKINRSAYVKRQMWAMDFCLQRPNNKLGNVPNKTDSKGETK